MEQLLTIDYRNHRERGLTLIEVLIALAIIGIALTAIIKATSQNIRSTEYLRQKTIAMWVGEQVMNEALIGILSLPTDPDHLKQQTTFLDHQWTWTATQMNTPNPHIVKLQVEVFPSDESDGTPILSLESYGYHENA